MRAVCIRLDSIVHFRGSVSSYLLPKDLLKYTQTTLECTLTTPPPSNWPIHYSKHPPPPNTYLHLIASAAKRKTMASHASLHTDDPRTVVIMRDFDAEARWLVCKFPRLAHRQGKGKGKNSPVRIREAFGVSAVNLFPGSLRISVAFSEAGER